MSKYNSPTNTPIVGDGLINRLLMKGEYFESGSLLWK